MLRYLSAGESHGQGLIAIIEGLPAGLKLNLNKINIALKRRQGGYGRGQRMQIEEDQVQILSGVRGGLTLGSPLTLMVKNKDWDNWQEIMSPGEEAQLTERTVTKPRPGHADLAGAMKYRQRDIRNILERASARETAIRVAVGAVCQEFLQQFAIRVQGQVIAIGEVKAETTAMIIGPELYKNPFYCPDDRVLEDMIKLVDQAKKDGDSLGGIFQVIVEGLPPGIGTHVQWDRRLDGLLAQGLMSIPAIKGVEIGSGFQNALLPGSQVHDEISYNPEKGFHHLTNRAGGLEGGITNGEKLIVKVAMKPIPTLYTPLQSVDIQTKEPFQASIERSDVCAVPAAAIVGENVVAWTLAGVILEKFGGDHLTETLGNYQNYLDYLKNW